MHSYRTLSFEVSGRIGLLTLWQAHRRNCLSEELKAELRHLVGQLAHDGELGALVITGEGNVFCSGGDLRELATMERSAEADRRRLYQSHDWVQPFMNLELPVIAAVNGPAVGAGFGVALAADFVLCAENAWFSASFSRVGLVGLFFTLPRVVGLQTAKELIFTGRRVTASEALALRIAMAVPPLEHLVEEALALARRFESAPTAAIGASKRVLNPPSTWMHARWWKWKRHCKPPSSGQARIAKRLTTSRGTSRCTSTGSAQPDLPLPIAQL